MPLPPWVAGVESRLPEASLATLGSMESGRGHNKEEANKVIWNNLPAELVDTSAAGKLLYSSSH